MRSRDPRNSISVEPDRVIRRFDPQGLQHFRAVEHSGILRSFAERRWVTDYEWVGESAIGSPVVTPISYPYEWPIEMLFAAAELTLEIAVMAWEAGIELRDASAFNVVFRGAEPTFVDFGSFQPGRPGAWSGYGQFCDHFLTPLLFWRHLAIPHQQLFGEEGIDPGLAASLFRGMAAFRRGVFRHVRLRNRLEVSAQGIDARSRRELRSISLPPEVVKKNLDTMTQLIRLLRPSTASSSWSDYEQNNVYSDSESRARDAFVVEAWAGREMKTVVDVGCNTGRHSALLAAVAEQVVAIDSDASSVGVLYRRMKDGTYPDNIIPVVADIAAPTPPRGFLAEERVSLLDRIRADGAVWLAVVHHLVLVAGVPLPYVAELMARVATRHVVEFVEPEDPMADLLAAAKRGEHHPYSRTEFEAAIADRFEIAGSERVSATRRLYSIESRG